MARSGTFDQGTRARELFDAGKSCNAIARELGFSPSTISRWAKREGVSFDRAKTVEAVAAHRIDRALIRADIIDRMYLRSQKVLTRLEADTFTYRVPTQFGSDLVSDEDPPAGDEKNLAAALGIYTDKATRLELVDSDAGESGARSMLADLGQMLGLADVPTV
ncbi:helix-turn-helix domain-containing protein [Cryobacterium sp. PH31-AA6]|uniref:helix-turn-helix domain-containing protein n=1 Tax=Cryobacterium sp. PH31-AA6 TaxID=3046205 RepID=UPI0024B940C7|nr:helix-turn-helix domain-containing protein [Cryobacterium sp. PH31-AA6]MDJ0323180.1 helix-turn-helix domain-containing protein [Cryobacterium sp. PH31-AA6]